MFSGRGGVEVGWESSKHEFENVGFCEVDKYATSVYTRHFPEHRNYGDATEIDADELDDFDFLVGGFPCQAFSLAGKRKGFNDTRGTLFFEIARVLENKKPKYFLLENVKGLLSHEGGRTIQKIFEVCDELGYDVSWEIYNSKDYGVPQNRERIFIKGYFRGKCGQEILCQSRNRQEVDGKLIRLNNKAQAQTVYNIDGLATTLSANGGGQGGKTGLYKVNKVGNINPNKPHQSGDVYSPVGLARCLTHTDSSHPQFIKEEYGIKKVGNISPSGHHNGDVFSTEGVSRTLCARDYKDAVKISSPDDPAIRRLTPLECERLQGFEDNWTKYGKDGELISDTQRYKCCGNAVTTNVVTAIVDEMFDNV